MAKVILAVVLIAAIIVTAIYAPQISAFLIHVGLSAYAATMVITLSIGLMVSVLARLIMPKPKQVSQSLFDRLNLTVDPTAPRKIVFGKTAAGADVRYYEVTDTSTTVNFGLMGLSASTAGAKWLHWVVALSSHKLNSVQSIYLEDVLCYSGGSTTGTYASQGALGISVVLEGNASNARAVGSGAYWTPTATFTGCSYLVLAMKDDAKVYANGIPQRITTIVEGTPVYDPRLDSTVGGSGPMRATDQTTWAYYNGSDEIGRNPALCLITYLLGYRINGVIAWGMGIPTSRIDFGNFITYANVCDEAVTTKDGGTVKRYQCDGIFSTADSHETIFDGVCAAMGTTKLLDVGGLYQFVGGADDLASPILELGPDDIIQTGYQWKPSPPARDRHNIARGRFADPAQYYVLNDWPEVSTSPLADNVPRVLQLDFNCVSRSESCQRIAKQMLVRGAYPGTFTATFLPKAFAAQVGSLVHMTLPQEGWNQKLFRVVDQTETADMIFQMTLMEENAAIYAWSASEAEDLPAVIRPPGYDPFAYENLTGLTASARTLANSTGGSDSYIDVTWTAATTNPAYVEIQFKASVDTVWTTATDRTDSKALAFSFRAPASGISTDVRARYIMQTGIASPWATATITAAVGTGANAVVGYLEDESITLPCDASGNVL